jgi:hypothetical protein
MPPKRSRILSTARSAIQRFQQGSRSPNRTRTVTVRPSLDFARSRVAILSARWRNVGRKTRSFAGWWSSHQRFLCDDMIAVKQAAIAGLGVVALPGYVWCEDVRLGVSRRVLPAWLAGDSTITLSFPIGAASSPRYASSSTIVGRVAEKVRKVRACALGRVSDLVAAATEH